MVACALGYCTPRSPNAEHAFLLENAPLVALCYFQPMDAPISMQLCSELCIGIHFEVIPRCSGLQLQSLAELLTVPET